MKIGLFRRAMSYIFDALPILMLVTASISWFAGDMIKNSIDDFDILHAEYTANYDAYILVIEDYQDDYAEGLISSEELSELEIEENAQFISDNKDLIDVVVYRYFSYQVIYIFLTFGILYTTYQIVLKGQTLGRKLLKIELQGKTHWYNIIIREFFWKHLFWTFTFGLGILVDVGFIVFSSKKKTIRDSFSQSYLTPQGVNYPF